MLAGLVLRVITLLVVRALPLDGDAASYHATAESMIGRARWEPDWPPGLPAYLAFGYKLFGAKAIVSRVMMLPVYLGFSAALFALTRRIAGIRAANLALVIFALSPAAIWNSVVPLTQLAAAALTIVVVLLADRCVSARKGHGVSALLLGVALAALILTRPANLALAAIPAYLALKVKRWEVFAVPTLVIACAIGGWTGYVKANLGHWVLINNANSQNVYYGNNPWTPTYRTWWFGSHKDTNDPTVPRGFLEDLWKIYEHPVRERDKIFAKRASDHIKDRPDLFALRTVNRVRTFFGFDTFTSAQVAKQSRLAGVFVLGLDVVCYLAVMLGLLLAPTAWPKLRERLAADPDHPYPLEIVRVFAVALLLAAAPYFVTFSHPTFHQPFVGLAGALASGVLVIALEGGLRAVWSPATRRARVGVALAMVAFFAIQIEWAIHVLSRANQG